MTNGGAWSDRVLGTKNLFAKAATATGVVLGLIMSVSTVPAHAAVQLTITLNTNNWQEPSTTRVAYQYGFDIKQGYWDETAQAPAKTGPMNDQPTAAESAAPMQFATGQFSVLRMPIVAGARPGTSLDTIYAPALATEQAVKTSDANVKLYANLLLMNANKNSSACQQGTSACDNTPFSSGIEGSNFVANYASALEAYLQWWWNKGVHIDDMGILCEEDATALYKQSSAKDPTTGAITAVGSPNTDSDFESTYETVVSDVKNFFGTGSPVLPTAWVGPDFKHPGRYPSNDKPAPLTTTPWTWITAVAGAGQVGVVSTHYYSNNRTGDGTTADPGDFTDLGNFVATDTALTNPRPIWDTEFHWSANDLNGNQLSEYDEARLGLFSAFDNFDQAVSNLTWWAYDASDNGFEENSLQTSLVSSTAGNQQVANPTNSASASTAVGDGKLVVRAYRVPGGNATYLLVLNDTATGYTQVQIRPPANTRPVYTAISPAPSGSIDSNCQLWQEIGVAPNNLVPEPETCTTGNTMESPANQYGVDVLSIPAHSIALVGFNANGTGPVHP